MTIYTSRLIVIPNYSNRLRLNSSSNSSYSFQHEIFRSTLIVLPYSNRKRFIQGIEVQCGSFMNDRMYRSNSRFESISPVGTISDVFSADESISEYHPIRQTSIVGQSYSDVRQRLLAKSNLFAYSLKDDTDVDDNDSVSCSSMGYSYRPGNYHKK
ncbi:unnamed protein product [Rotaria sp. Silwood2]|nr:unnamed protein product [Rotaria sp. Silwood2]CAF2801836.1 unnamed protein product [Rotaria sp. Silwood2]CAF3095036.1 unnamed protein product [Rotaria sp. Silwood2]CAF3193012.1 unnamed protein product [Rotaria sp. Silwood2]CAF3868711.1 unnamed protein product [Rotaria sp. Silwood2]